MGGDGQGSTYRGSEDASITVHVQFSHSQMNVKLSWYFSFQKIFSKDFFINRTERRSRRIRSNFLNGFRVKIAEHVVGLFPGNKSREMKKNFKAQFFKTIRFE
jgi:hypothetical protein